ncbi:hypothetical protein [Acinetobacter sp. TSRC1-2]|uniref:hypothetical protein n=1 Tax=unclassified Acinetobacter TaxID=196816 RepID=UPI003CEF3A4A
MANEKALTFNKTSKTIANTNDGGAYPHLDSSCDQHQVKVVVTHNNQKFEMFMPVVLQHATPTAMLFSESFQNSEVEQEVLKFAQSIVGFHQDKDSYPLSLLDDHS